MPDRKSDLVSVTMTEAQRRLLRRAVDEAKGRVLALPDRNVSQDLYIADMEEIYGVLSEVPDARRS